MALGREGEKEKGCTVDSNPFKTAVEFRADSYRHQWAQVAGSLFNGQTFRLATLDS